MIIGLNSTQERLDYIKTVETDLWEQINLMNSIKTLLSEKKGAQEELRTKHLKVRQKVNNLHLEYVGFKALPFREGTTKEAQKSIQVNEDKTRYERNRKGKIQIVGYVDSPAEEE